MTPAPDGILVVDKAAGMTSHDVVAAVRRRLARGTKVGHTGTLDPFATGVLPIVIGKATRLAQFLTAGRKRYHAVVAFGAETDSGDCTGDICATVEPADVAAVTAETLRAALSACVGTHAQVPPAHSAKKVDGHRAYDLARRGAAVVLAPVDVTAWTVDLVGWDPAAGVATVDLETSPGYYVRSFARDLGRRLGVPAHLSALRRTASGAFSLEHARTLADVLSDPAQLAASLVPPVDALPDMPAMVLDGPRVDDVRHGRPVPATGVAAPPDGRIRLIDADGRLVGLARPWPDLPNALRADVVLL